MFKHASLLGQLGMLRIKGLLWFDLGMIKRFLLKSENTPQNYNLNDFRIIHYVHILDLCCLVWRPPATGAH